MVLEEYVVISFAYTKVKLFLTMITNKIWHPGSQEKNCFNTKSVVIYVAYYEVQGNAEEKYP